MVRCVLCSNQFKTERGLSVHLSRTHNIHGLHGRLSLDITINFFPLLEKNKWAKAEKVLKKVTKTTRMDQWIRGYLHALGGMIISLRTSHSTPQPYIVNINDKSDKKLEEAKNGFNQLSKKLKNKKQFDAAYFHAWQDFTQYLLKTKSKNT